MDPIQACLLFGAAALAGAINAIAGGGTLVTFTALLAAGSNPISANATSTVSLWPGSLGGTWGYRRELRRSLPWLWLLAVPSLLGGATGAELLLRTPPGTFKVIVPFLILFASSLILAHEPIGRLLKLRKDTQAAGPAGLAAALLFQFAVAVYGGYFGAGIGILMIACLSLLRIGDIHQMNGIKSVLAMCINGVATTRFAVSGRVDWACAAVMAVGAIAGGYGGARLALKIGQRPVRWLVVAIGFALAAYFFWTHWTERAVRSP